MKTMDDQSFIESLDPEELSIYKDLLMKEYSIISENSEAFISYDKMSDMDKVSKMGDIYDVIFLDDCNDPRLDRIIDIMDIISIKNLKNKNIH
jgi:hypothetical protein